MGCLGLSFEPDFNSVLSRFEHEAPMLNDRMSPASAAKGKSANAKDRRSIVVLP
jgi:hypothetical protein